MLDQAKRWTLVCLSWHCTPRAERRPLNRRGSDFNSRMSELSLPLPSRPSGRYPRILEILYPVSAKRGETCATVASTVLERLDSRRLIRFAPRPARMLRAPHQQTAALPDLGFADFPPPRSTAGLSDDWVTNVWLRRKCPHEMPISPHPAVSLNILRQFQFKADGTACHKTGHPFLRRIERPQKHSTRLDTSKRCSTAQEGAGPTGVARAVAVTQAPPKPPKSSLKRVR